MEKIAKPLALLALALTIGPPAWMFFQGVSSAPPAAAAEAAEPDSPASTVAAEDSPSLMTDSRMKFLMAVGAVLWFVAAPSWLKEDKPAEEIIEKQALQAVP
jgi:hypothetical protein